MINRDVANEFCAIRDKIIEERYKDLNDNQRKAVLNNDRNLALIACPGAGKTSTLIRKVDYLVTFGNVYKTNFIPKGLTLEDVKLIKGYFNNQVINNLRVKYLLGYKAISPNNIIVITFTRAAALNMKEKYKKMSKCKAVPFFGTFHGLFYKILSRIYGNINIIQSNKAYRLIKGVLSAYLEQISDEKVKETINAISFYKTNNITMKEFTTNIDKDIFVECYRTYEDYKSQNNLLDFDDLQIRCKELFLKDERFLKGYRNLFKYMLVDEFQDCDEIEIDILKLLNEDNSIFAVGDEDQCIYSFRGAKPECMVNFQYYFNDGKKLFLGRNYRCPDSVVEISDNLIKNNKMRNNKIMYAQKEYRPKINVMNYKNENMQAEDISLNIIKLKGLNQCEYNENAILYRTNVESRSIIDSFIRKKIPFKLLDKEYNFFEHFICKDVLAYLKLSIDSSDKESFFRIINKPFRYISKINIEKVRKSTNRGDCFENLKSIDNLPVFQLKSIDELKKDIQRLNKMSLSGAISSILSNLGYYDYLKEYSSKFKIDISELEEILEEFKASAEEYKTIITFLVHVDEVEEEIIKNKRNENKDSVILSTIHGVKGMEFKNVFIINCNEENIPHINSMDENIEEERRLFYVGITRTIENLSLCISNEIRGKNKKVSRFIKECKLYSLFQNTYKIGERIIHKSFGEGEVKFIDDKKIEIEFNNKIIRTFDVLVIYNNGLIKKY
ncbi:ATP-dependent helicase [Clostridium ganghwense]|uniref:DNA 3'-5' helicase n=1 Tax=Clostridium ganghwense TaxID=312089 RepID=A0ABT4CP77_9CLOT|nr:ATP-dependent helicase [Clostridium ganghwense]MCY6370860.1 ATP-dependent helicase [Clostridium ganghwense]